MATLTYYKAVDSITDGSKGTQVTSGEIDSILPFLTSQQRIAGITQLEKFYIQATENLEVYVGFTDLGLFNGIMIDSTGDSEVAGDVSSSSPRYGSAEIITNDADGCTIKHNENIDLFRVDDFVLIGDVVVQIDTISANTTDRVITYKFTIPYVDLTGSNLTSVLQKSLTANVATPLWVENIVVAGSPATQTYNTVPLVVVS